MAHDSHKDWPWALVSKYDEGNYGWITMDWNVNQIEDVFLS